MEFVGYVKGGLLERDEVFEARKLEVDYVRNMGCTQRSRRTKHGG